MAKTSKNKMTEAAKKKKAAAKTVKETKVEEVKEVKVEEVKAIAAAEEPKKITAAKEPEKIAVAKEPEKIETKAVEVKEEAKEEKKAPAKKAAAKKTTTKKATAKKAVKEEVKEEKAEVKEEAKEEKKAPAKKAAAKKTTAKKATTKKAAAKKEEKVEAKEEKKAPAKKASKKTTKKDKLAAYAELSLDECIARMNAMGVQHGYDVYAEFLLDEADLKQLEKNIVEGNNLKDKGFDFDKDGYDVDLVAVTLQKVADTMDIKALDFKEIKKEMNAAVKVKFTDDAEANAAEYLKEFKICEKLLMIGQRKNIGDSAAVTELLGSDVDKFVDHFFAFAYDVLPTWQYDDVKFYEDFAFAVLSQYYDLFTKYQLRILIDIADLYIKHGDFQHGDECYGYILRDNQIKDYIYFRFASVYEAIDFNKAKQLAYESLQYVDGRYTYYNDIMAIINK